MKERNITNAATTLPAQQAHKRPDLFPNNPPTRQPIFFWRVWMIPALAAAFLLFGWAWFLN